MRHNADTDCDGTECPVCGCCQHTPLSKPCDCAACSCQSYAPKPKARRTPTPSDPSDLRTTDQTDRPEGASE